MWYESHRFKGFSVGCTQKFVPKKMGTEKWVRKSVPKKLYPKKRVQKNGYNIGK